MSDKINGKYIFTFWEPKEKLPGYIKLCMRTWQKYIPDYEATVLDYGSLAEYLPKDVQDAMTCRELTLPKQSDAYRCALLREHGGIWMDADTIINSSFDMSYFCQGKCCTVGSKKVGYINGAYIYAATPGAKVVSEWYDELKEKLVEYRMFVKWKPFFHIFKRSRWRVLRRWDYCMNSILEPMVARMDESEFALVDRVEARCFPENMYSDNPHMDNRNLYRRFWFTEGETSEKWAELERNKGLIMLHNSWTPIEYKQMTEEEFLNSGCFLALYLKKLLAD